MNVNYFAPLQIIQGLEKQLTGGHVAVVASMVAIILGGINYTSYGASKKAIFHYLTSLRQ
jgi:short-subunit dehydrogenase